MFGSPMTGDGPDATQCHDQHPHHNSERNDGERDLDPQAEIPQRGLNAVSPRIREKPTTCFDHRRRGAFPPGERLRHVQPAIHKYRQNCACGPRPEKMAAQPSLRVVPRWCQSGHSVRLLAGTLFRADCSRRKGRKRFGPPPSPPAGPSVRCAVAGVVTISSSTMLPS
jgi:hypothetical protein